MEEVQVLLNTLLVTILTGVISIAGAYATLLLKKVTTKIQAETSKIESDKERILVNDAIMSINDLVYQAVFAMQTTTVDAIKDKAEDGKLTVEEGKEIANTVKDNVLAQLSTEVQSLATKQIENLDLYILDRIEVELEKVKTELASKE